MNNNKSTITFLNGLLTSDKQIIIALIPLMLFLGALLLKSYSLPLNDFSNYYYGAEVFHDKKYEGDIYNSDYFNECLLDKEIENVFVAFYPNAPSILLLYKPLLSLNPHIAKLLLNLLSAILLLLSLAKLAKQENFKTWFFVILPVIFYLPLKNSIFFGQPYLLIVSLLIVTYISLSRNKYFLSSLSYTVACLYKLSPSLLLIYFFAHRKWTILIQIFLIGTFTIMASTVIIGSDIWLTFIEAILPQASNGVIYNGFDPRAKSAVVLFKNLFVYDSLLNPVPFINSTSLFTIIFTGYKAILFYLGFRLSSNNENLDNFFIWLLIALLVSPNLGSYSFVLLIPLFLSFLKKSENLRLIICGLFFLLCNIPLLKFQVQYPNANFMQIFLCLIILIGYYSKMKLEALTFNKHLVVSVIAILIFLIPSINFLTENKNSQKESYVLPKDEHMLIKDFEIKNNSLIYYHWSLNGTTRLVTDLTYNLHNGPQPIIRSGNIFIGDKQITYNSASKKKPIRVSEDQIIFLSDKNRAPGFYTLKMVKF